jgi:hypothetical protein
MLVSRSKERDSIGAMVQKKPTLYQQNLQGGGSRQGNKTSMDVLSKTQRLRSGKTTNNSSVMQMADTDKGRTQ